MVSKDILARRNDEDLRKTSEPTINVTAAFVTHTFQTLMRIKLILACTNIPMNRRMFFAEFAGKFLQNLRSTDM
jgi:hypothetical protein